MRVKPLDTSQKEQIITDYLEGIYGKTLNAEQKQLLVDSEQTNNPLYLKSLLDEVLHFCIKGTEYTLPASVAQLDALSDWRLGGRGFNPC